MPALYDIVRRMIIYDDPVMSLDHPTSHIWGIHVYIPTAITSSPSVVGIMLKIVLVDGADVDVITISVLLNTRDLGFI